MRPGIILHAVIALWILTLSPLCLLAQVGNDCRQRKPTPERSLDLSGEWMDNSVNLKVTITQDGIDLGQIINIKAKYLVPYKCAQNANDGKAVFLDLDLTGRLSQANPGAHPEITGAVYICQDVRGANTTLYSERVQGALTLTVSDGRDSMTGDFADPAKGDQRITLTRLSKIETPPVYAPQTIVLANTAAKIYAEPLRSSRILYTPPTGTRLIFDNARTILDADGHPTWYSVTNATGSIGSTDIDWIGSSQITCTNPNTSGPK